MLFAACAGTFEPPPLQEDVAAALAQAQPKALQDTIARLQARPPDDAILAALAQLQLALQDYYIAPAQLDDVNHWAEQRPPDDPLSRLLRADLALRTGDIARARQILGPAAPSTDEERYLYARISLAAAEASTGLVWLEGLSAPSTPRSRLLRARLLMAAGQADAARQEIHSLLVEAPELISAQVARVEVSQTEVQAQLADLVLLRYNLPERLKAYVLALQARALLGKDKDKAQTIAFLAQAIDGTEPDALLVLADADARQGKLRSAFADLEPAPLSSPDPQIARLLLLLDLDRLDEAQAFLNDLEHRQVLSGLLPSLQYLLSVGGFNKHPEIPLPPIVRPLDAYNQAIAAILALDPLATQECSDAMERLRESTNPFELGLIGRLLAQRAILQGEQGGIHDARQAILDYPEDPAVHMLIGNFYELSHRPTGRALAAAHYSRATLLGPELARAWFERGRFYQDAPDNRTREAWTQYLALDPSGPRAQRASTYLQTTP